MSVPDRLRPARIRELAGLVTGHGILRRAALNVAGSRAHEFIAGEYGHDRSLQVRRDIHSYLMALLYGADRAIERGFVSRQ